MNTRSRLLRLFVVPLVIVAFAAACAPQDEAASDAEVAAAAADASADAAALDALLESYVEHFNLGHAGMVADLYADDAVTVFANGGVQLGREEIEAGLAGSIEGFGVLGINRDELHVAGDNAVARGNWSSETAVEGAEPIVVSGHYMTWFARVDGDWKIQVVASNYDSPQPAEAYMGEVSPNVDDVEDDALDGLMTAYEASWAAGDVAALGMLYTEDAYVSGNDRAPVQGRAAIEASLAERISGTLDIHAKDTMDLGDGWAVNGGWYEADGDDGPRRGNYLLLASIADDGSAQIHWLVSNSRPFLEE